MAIGEQADLPLTDHTNLATLSLGVDSESADLPSTLNLEAGSIASSGDETRRECPRETPAALVAVGTLSSRKYSGPSH